MTAKSVLVVGGAGGVGSALVKRSVDRGYKVVTTVLDPKEAAEIEKRYEGAVQCHVLDLSDAEKVLIRMKEIVASLDRLDVVAMCAAIAPCLPAELTPLATFRKCYEINCVSEIAIYQAAMPALRKTGGRVLFLSSAAGKAAYTFMSSYIATKFALEGLCDVMRREAAPQGVKVILIEPGGIRTNLVYQQLIDVRRDLAALSEEQKSLYGYLYEGYLRVAERGLDGAGSGSSPDQVAEVLMEAVEAEEPETRYIVGEDAKQLLGAIRTMSDRDIDNMFNQMFLS